MASLPEVAMDWASSFGSYERKSQGKYVDSRENVHPDIQCSQASGICRFIIEVLCISALRHED